MKTEFPAPNPILFSLPIYEPGRPIEDVAREMGFDDISEIIKVASNENALGPSPKAIAAMHAYASAMHLYPDGGCHALRAAISASIGLPEDCIVPGNGSNELIELLGHVYLQPGLNIVMATQAFLIYRIVAAASKAGVIDVPMANFTHDLKAMRDAITDGTRIVFIANPNNPTGTIVSQDDIERYMDAVPPHVVTCFDEAYVELLQPDLQPDVLKFVREGRPVIVLRTFSKAYGLAGLRVGYGVAPPEVAALLHRVRQPFNVNAMAQHAAIGALGDRDHVAQTRTMVTRGLEQLTHGCRKLGLACVPSVANFMLVKVGKGRAVFTELMKKGIIVRPMDAYGLPEYVRITVGTRLENERVLSAMQGVLAI